MVTKQVGDIINLIDILKLDGLMNAANGKGPMGFGIAGAIKHAGGTEIQSDAFEVCFKLDPQPGQAYSTISGTLKDKGIKRIIHAVTMKSPAGYTSLDIIEAAFKSALILAKQEGITKLGCTALGTGVGRLSPIDVGIIMSRVAKSGIVDIDVAFVDRDQRFIDAL